MNFSALSKHVAGSLFILLLLFGCSENPILGVPSQPAGIPTDQMSFVQWTPEMVSLLQSTARQGLASHIILPGVGGTVGGNQTYGNSVYIPGDAISEATEFSVEVLCVDSHQQCGAGVEFLPGTDFEAPVQITLSFEYLNLSDQQIEDLYIYFSQDGNFWYPIDGFEINDENEIISFWIDHFTVFAWEF